MSYPHWQRERRKPTLGVVVLAIICVCGGLLGAVLFLAGLIWQFGG